MSTIPSLSEREILARVGEASFRRAQSYFQGGAIFDARRQGLTLKASCEGSHAPSYDLQVTFDATGGITQAQCSCPVGDGGCCKHSAALLLTWLHSPANFVELEDLDTALARRGKEELVALIKQMLRQHPALELLLETPLPGAGMAGRPVTPEAYRRQAAAAFRRAGYEWGAENAIAADLSALVQIGDGFVTQDDAMSAAVVYEAVATEILQSYEGVHDETGELSAVVDDCVEGLGRCLTGQKESAPIRQAVLRALFTIYQSDVELGGLGLGEDAPDLILAQATSDERRMVADWLRAVLPPPTDAGAAFRRQTFGAFLLELEQDTLDDEAFLRLCRELGRTFELIDRLLALGRVPDAVAEAQKEGGADPTALATLFVEHDQSAVAERLMRGWAAAKGDTRLLEWVKERHKERADWVGALELAESIFRTGPSLSTYKELRQLAGQLDRWEAARPRVLAFLARRELTRLLIQIYLDEGEVDGALTALKTARLGWATGCTDNIALHVAEAAEKTRPRAALDIYKREAEHLITQQGRDNYRAAARLLVKVRALHETLGETWAWTGYLNGLRETHRRLRAFAEELAAAKL